MAKKYSQKQFHRSQIGKAQIYLRKNFCENNSLEQIAREAGASPYHFARLFSAYTDETIFDYIKRLRIKKSIELLIEKNSKKSITDIALQVGYETPSSFNKAFKSLLQKSPSEFRNLGKAEQSRILYRMNKPTLRKESKMKFDLNYEIVKRPETFYLHIENRGPFHEIAPPLWQNLLPLIEKNHKPFEILNYMGMGTIDKSKTGDDAMIYQAGYSVIDEPKNHSKDLSYRKIPSGNYARFLLKGPYSELWTAFDAIFKKLSEDKISLRQEYCIENYLNDPSKTPEANLRTEILIPVN